MVLTKSEAPKMKTCRKCGEEKACEEFGTSPWTQDGRLNTCRLCASAAMKAGHARRRAAVTSAPPSAAKPSAAQEALSEADWHVMFMLIILGCNEYIKAMKECYSDNDAAFQVQQAIIMKAFERPHGLLPAIPDGGDGRK
jgi:hypothetical protein